jgi:GTPase SAR1 family protein
VGQWIKDAREYSKPDIEILVVGNKTDLLDERLFFIRL